jgi:hypothetical protein
MKLMIKIQLILFLLIFQLGCSGYYLKKNNNPFEQYNITSLYVPLFYNHSNLPFASAELTRAFINELMPLKGIKIVTNKAEPADAILLGIFSSTPEMSKTYRTARTALIKSEDYSNIGTREDFLVPSETKGTFNLQIMVLRAATDEQIEYLLDQKSNPFELPEMILNHRFDMSFTFERLLFSDEYRSVNFTQSIGNRDFAFQVKSKEVAREFRTIVLSNY